jgi:hypothetical protein
MRPVSERVATTDDEQRRADYLAEVTALLYPEAGGLDRPVDYIAVPSLRRPRVLVPAASRRLAATALRHYARPASLSARLKRDAAVAALLSGVDRLMLPDRISLRAGGEDIGGYLSGVLGTDVHLGIHIGPARANRKPVLQLLNAHAETIGFAKLGNQRLTRALVNDETAALRTLAELPLRHLRVPKVLHSGTWRDCTVLVQEPVPGWRRPDRLDHGRLQRAMRELALCQGIEDTTVARSPYAKLLRERLDGLAERGDEDAMTLVDAARMLLDRHGELRLRFGSWHGDWTPWNMALRPQQLLLWDFERFATGVPMGFDALHFAMQRDIITRGWDPTTAVVSLLSRSSRLLRPFEVAESAARVTALLYLVDLAVRYLTDRQAEAGAALGALGRWLLPTLLRHVAAEGGVVL